MKASLSPYEYVISIVLFTLFGLLSSYSILSPSEFNSSPDYSNIVPESLDTFTHDTNIFETNSPKKDIHSNVI